MGFLLKDQGPASQPCVPTRCPDRGDETTSCYGGDGRRGSLPRQLRALLKLVFHGRRRREPGGSDGQCHCHSRDSEAPVPALSWVFSLVFLKGKKSGRGWENTVCSHCWACRLYYSLRWCEVGTSSPFMTDGDTEAERALCGRAGLASRPGLPGSAEGTIAWAPGFDSRPVSSPKSSACTELPVCTALR